MLSGKSQLCRTVVGLDDPAAGQVLVGGIDQADVDPRRRPVAMVYQAFVNYPHWTVAQNIASPLVARGLSVDQREHQVDQLAQILGLHDLLDRTPDALSGGQQQRLAIARALAKQASVLVMDEPFVNLDYKLREGLRAELRDIVAEQELTVLYTTSDPAEAFALADQLVLLADHGIVQVGTPLEVYRKPKNLMAADLMSDPGVNRLQLQAQEVAVRPEHVRLSADGLTDAVELSVAVLDTETNGSETFVHAQSQGQDWVIKLQGLHRFAAGQALSAYVAADDVIRWDSRG